MREYLRISAVSTDDASEFWAVSVSAVVSGLVKRGEVKVPYSTLGAYEKAELVAAAACRHGKPNVFRISDGLAEQLALTDISGVDGADLRFPFPGLWLRIPRSAAITLPGTTGRLSVRMVGVAEVVASYNGDEVTLGDGPGARRSILVVAISEAPAGNGPAHATVISDISPGPLEYMPRGGDTLHIGDSLLGTEGLRQLAIGALLYITSPNPDVRPASNAKNVTAWDEAVTAGRTRPHAPGRKPGSRMLWDVGASIKRLRVAALDVLVRGHWRRQSHGPRHTLRKMIWVQPHVRMPTGCPTAGHDYVVAEAS
jgi:hypothetical protein